MLVGVFGRNRNIGREKKMGVEHVFFLFLIKNVL